MCQCQSEQFAVTKVTNDRYMCEKDRYRTREGRRCAAGDSECAPVPRCAHGPRHGSGAPFVLSWRMVFYFECSDPRYTIYMGRDKFENEHLIANGWPEDLWCVHGPRLHSDHGRQQPVA